MLTYQLDDFGYMYKVDALERRRTYRQLTKFFKISVLLGVQSLLSAYLV